MYKSYSYSNMPMPVNKKKEPPQSKPSQKDGDAKHEEIKERDTKPCEKNNGLFDNLETDDIILLIVAFVLLMDDCDDKLLLGALAFIFLSGNC